MGHGSRHTSGCLRYRLNRKRRRQKQIAFLHFCVSDGEYSSGPRRAAQKRRRFLALGFRCGSEAGLFQQSGIPAVICGPGSVTQAHQPNEFVAVAQFDECAELLGKVADWAERG